MKSNLKQSPPKRVKKSTAPLVIKSSSKELEISFQLSKALSPATVKLLKPIFTKKNIQKWISWAINPDAHHLREVSLRVVDDKEGLAINRQFRGRDYATNILTFNAFETSNPQADLLICAPVVIHEAREMGVALLEHCAHLIVHATLHAQGYDHEASAAQELEMETLESVLMMSLGFKDPYVI